MEIQCTVAQGKISVLFKNRQSINLINIRSLLPLIKINVNGP